MLWSSRSRLRRAHRARKSPGFRTFSGDPKRRSLWRAAERLSWRPAILGARVRKRRGYVEVKPGPTRIHVADQRLRFGNGVAEVRAGAVWNHGFHLAAAAQHHEAGNIPAN